jgi:hypothetical protein
MSGKNFGLVRPDVGKLAFESGGNPGVKLLPLRPQQGAIGRILD